MKRALNLLLAASVALQPVAAAAQAAGGVPYFRFNKSGPTSAQVPAPPESDPNAYDPAKPLTLSGHANPTGRVANWTRATYTARNTAPGAVTWSVTGSLPPGIDFADGVFSGTPLTAGLYPLTVSVSDNAGRSQSLDLTYEIGDNFVVTTASDRIGLLKGDPMAPVEFAVSGNFKAPLTWERAWGGLPPGLTFNRSTGTITGRPSAAGFYFFAIAARDADNYLAWSPSIRFDVAGDPVFTIKNLTATVGHPMSLKPVPEGAPGEPKWEITAGSLPDGTALDGKTGEIKGIPTAVNDHPITLTLTDVATGASYSRNVLVRVMSPDSVASVFPEIAVDGAAVNTAVFYDADTASTQGLPARGAITLTYDRPRYADGIVLSGSSIGSWALEYLDADGAWVRATSGTGGDTKGFKVATSQTWRVLNLNAYAFNVRTARLTSGGTSQVAPSVAETERLTPSYGKAFSQTLLANNLVGPASWRIVSGELPAGLSLGADGVISGQATGVAPVTVMVAVTDSRGVESAPKAIDVEVQAEASAALFIPLLNGSESAAALYDAAYDTTSAMPASGSFELVFPQPVAANGFTHLKSSGVSYSIHYMPVGGSGWVEADGSTSTNTSYAGSFPTATAQRWLIRNNSSIPHQTRTFRLTHDGAAPIAPSLKTTPVLLPSVSKLFTHPLQADNLGASGVEWRIVSGSLPDGLRMGTDGVITGTATQFGESAIQVSVRDSRGTWSVPAPVTLRVQSNAFASDRLPTLASGDTAATIYDRTSTTRLMVPAKGSIELVFDEPVSADSYSISRSNTADMTLSYMPVGGSEWVVARASLGTSTSSASTFPAVSAQRWRVTNNASQDTLLYSLRLGYGSVFPYAPTVTDPGLLTAPANTPYSRALAATDLDGSGVEWQVASGSLPDGLDLRPDGTITGSPSRVQEALFFVRVRDHRGGWSLPAPVQVNVLSGVFASGHIPSLNGTATAAALYDALATTKVDLPVGASVELVYPMPVTADSYVVDKKTSTPVELAYLPEGGSDWVVAETSVGGANATTETRDLAAPASARRWRLTNTSTIDNALNIFRLGYARSFQIAPAVTDPGVLAPFAGTPYTQQLAATNLGSQGVEWRLAEGSSLPDGLTLQAHGQITGTPAQAGESTAHVEVRDSRGTWSVPQALTLRVQASVTAATAFPTLNGTDSPAALYDASSTTAVAVPAGGTFELVYDQPVAADSFTVRKSSTAALDLSYMPEDGSGWVAVASNVASTTAQTTRTFAPVTARRWQVKNRGTSSIPVEYRDFRLGYGSVFPTAPSVAAPADALLPSVNTAFAHQLIASDLGAGAEWTTDAPLPDGLALGNDGWIRGTARAMLEATVNVSVKDVRGVWSSPTPVSFKVQSAVLASAKIPGLVGADTAAALYDASTTTSLDVPAGGSFELAFDEPVAANRLQLSKSTAAAIDLAYLPEGGADWVYLISNGAASTGATYTLDTSTARRWRVTSRGTGTASFRTFKLGYGTAYQTAPTVTPNLVFTPMLGSFSKNTLTASDLEAQGVEWSADAALPAGLTLNALTGDISGTPTEMKEVTINVRVKDHRGSWSLPQPATIRVQSDLKANEVLPKTTSSGEPAIFYDGRQDTSQLIVSNTIELDFGAPITADGMRGTSERVLELDYQPYGTATWQPLKRVGSTTNATLSSTTGTSVLTAAFQSATAQKWRIRNPSGSMGYIKDFQLTYGGAWINSPTITDPGLLKPSAGKSWSQTLVANNTVGTKTWSITKNALPPGLDLDPATGVISGTLAAGSAGAYTVDVSVVDPRGVRAIPVTLSFEVQSDVHASNVMPTQKSYPSLEIGGLYDGALGTQYFLTGGDSFTLTYDVPVLADGMRGTSERTIEIDYQPLGTTTWVTLDRVGSTTNANLPATTASTVSSASFAPVTAKSFRIRNISSSLTGYIKNLQITYGGTAPAAPLVTDPGSQTLTRGQPFTLALSATQTVGPVTWSIASSTQLPSTLVIDPATGVISGTPQTAGTYRPTVTVIDSRGVRAYPLTLNLVVQ